MMQVSKFVIVAGVITTKAFFARRIHSDIRMSNIFREGDIVRQRTPVWLGFIKDMARNGIGEIRT